MAFLRYGLQVEQSSNRQLSTLQVLYVGGIKVLQGFLFVGSHLLGQEKRSITLYDRKVLGWMFDQGLCLAMAEPDWYFL